jgi:hypothetical protein
LKEKVGLNFKFLENMKTADVLTVIIFIVQRKTKNQSCKQEKPSFLYSGQRQR